MRVQARGVHAGRPLWFTRWWVIPAAVALAGGGTAVGLIATAGPSPSQVRAHRADLAAAAAAARAQAESRLASAVTVSPASGAAGVPLNAVIKVSTSVGSLKSVEVLSGSGPALGGKWSATHTVWESAGALQPDATYRVVATVLGGGISAQRTASFKTLTPIETVAASVFPSSGMTVGVGQPIVVRFDTAISSAAEQQSVLSHFTVGMSKPVPGGWHWFSSYELHFRPEHYWPAGEQITLSGDLDGWNAGAGRWGSGQVSDSFAIGDARISYANLASEEMTVTLNGAVIATYPISGGRPKYPTMDGDHIVLDRESVVHMVSSTVGIPVNSPDGYDEFVYNDVHISDSGEYVHAAPWSVGAQGRTNVSHGCINLSPSNSLSFYDFSRVGDVVEVTGSPRPPAFGDHGVMDWSTPWSEWSPAHVVANRAATTTTTQATTTTTIAYHAAPTTSAPTTAPTTTATTTAATRPTTTPRVTTATTVAATPTT